MNKHGKTSPLLIGFAVVVVLALVFIGYSVSQSQTGKSDDTVKVVTGDCGGSDPIFFISALDNYNLATSVIVTAQYLQDGVLKGTYTSGTTKVPYGSKIQFLISNSSYIDTVTDTYTAKCGANSVDVKMKKATGGAEGTATNFAFSIWDSTGVILTDSVCGAANNQSVITSSDSLDFKISSTADETAGDLVIVVESSNTTGTDDMYISGFDGIKCDGVNVPEWYTVAGATSIAKACEITEIADGVSKQGSLVITAESGQDVLAGTNFYVTGYTKEWFVDTDGTFKYGIEDANGASKRHAAVDYDFCVGA